MISLVQDNDLMVGAVVGRSIRVPPTQLELAIAPNGRGEEMAQLEGQAIGQPVTRQRFGQQGGWKLQAVQLRVLGCLGSSGIGLQQHPHRRLTILRSGGLVELGRIR